METKKRKRTKKDVEIDMAKLAIDEQELRIKIEQIGLKRRKLCLEFEMIYK